MLKFIVVSKKVCTFALEMIKHKLYISIGTNLSTADQVLLWTKRKLAISFRGEAVYSTAVQTEPINFPDSAPFTNQLVELTTTLTTKMARPLLKQMERELGRTDEDKQRGVVRLDLDILWQDGEVLKPEDWERDWVKAAVAELTGGAGATYTSE